MDRPGPGRKLGSRTVAGNYFVLVSHLLDMTQHDVASRVGVAASTLSRGFSGQSQVEREKLLVWGDLLLELCPEEDRPLLLELEAEMLHAFGYSTREEKEGSGQRLATYEERVEKALEQRQRKRR